MLSCDVAFLPLGSVRLPVAELRAGGVGLDGLPPSSRLVDGPVPNRPDGSSTARAVASATGFGRRSSPRESEDNDLPESYGEVVVRAPWGRQTDLWEHPDRDINRSSTCASPSPSGR